MIPVSCPKESYLENCDEIQDAIRRVLESGWYVLGKEVQLFEQEFAEYLGAKHCVGVANGTDALLIALRVGDIQAGDRVATVAHTATATVAAIEMLGAVPVLIDIDPLTYNIDPQKFEDTIRRDLAEGTPIKCLIAVHLYGHPAALSSLVELCRKNDIALIEDCAQAHGARLENRALGTWADVSAFSFYPTKNLGAIGDGGAVVTCSPAIADRVRRLREYGWEARSSIEPGVNSRLDELQAAILRVKLKGLSGEISRRRDIASRYGKLLDSLELQLPHEDRNAEHAYHLYVVRTKIREQLRIGLRERGVGSAIHYAPALHEHPAYRDRVAQGVGGLIQTEAATNEILSLPMYPQLDNASIEKVASAVAGVFSGD
jgi:dTDP-4-amino-4,6-dideoxygalactose transaminase